MYRALLVTLFLFAIVTQALPSSYDYVIVGTGSGSAGFALGVIKSDPDASILILERGADESDNEELVYEQLNSLTPKNPTKTRPIHIIHTHETKLDGSLFNFESYASYAAGGGPVVAGSAALRANPKDFDYWKHNYGLEGHWSHSEIKECYKQVENYKNVYSEGGPTTKADRGQSGPVKVLKMDFNSTLNQPFIQIVSEQYNVPINHDLNGEESTLYGLGAFDRNLGHDGDKPERHAIYRDFLKPYADEHPDKVKIVYGATVTKVKLQCFLDNCRATQVLYSYQGETEVAHVKATGRVIVGAGVQQTAKILMFSGIGDCDELESFGLPCQIDLPGVGKNLKDHGFFQTIFGLPGVTPENGPINGAFFDSPYADVNGTIDTEVACQQAKAEGVPFAVFFCILVSLNQDTQGTTKLIYPDPERDLRITQNYNLDPTSNFALHLAWLLKNMREAMVKYRENTGKNYVEIEPGYDLVPKDATVEEIATKIDKLIKTEWHGAGTARMGNDEDEMAVLHEYDLRVRGTSNLHVVDTSAHPFPIRSHPFMAISSMAIKAAIRLINPENPIC